MTKEVDDKNGRLKVLYYIQGLPLSAVGKTWDDVALAKPEADRLSGMFANIPSNVRIIYVQGSAAPIINQLYEQKAKIRGIDAGIWFEDPFSPHDYPDGEVIVLYDFDDPISVPKVTVPIIKGIISYYGGKSIPIIIESKETAAAFEANYGVKITNKIKIPELAEPKWL